MMDTPATAQLLVPLRRLAFRWLALGQIFSLLGDQMYLVALPWLALQLTGSATVLGAVLTAAALPRAVFIVLGGALADRWNPKYVMIVSSALSAAVTLLLTIAIAFGGLQVWQLFLAAVVLGLVDAMYYPASSTILPRVLRPIELAPGNAIASLVTQTVGFVGPGIAGFVVAWNVPAAFAISVVCSLLSIAALFGVRFAKAGAPVPEQPIVSQADQENTRGVLAGLRFVWNHPGIRGMVLLLAGLNLALIGPYLVGGGLLAAERFGGAPAFGALLSAFGAGGMLGTILAGSMPQVRRLGVLALAVALILGVGTIAVAFAPNLLIAGALAFAMGCAEGLEEVQLITWFQQVTPPAIRGRVMGFVSLAAVGLEPVSFVLAGVLGTYGAGVPFMVGGCFTLLVAALLACSRAIRTLEA